MAVKKNMIRIEAGSRDEAIKLAWKEFQKSREFPEELVPEEVLEVKKVDEKKSFLGISKKKVFTVSLRQEVLTGGEMNEPEDDDGFLSQMVIDGFYSFKFSPQGIYLKVQPPVGRGEPVPYLKVEKAIEEKQLVEVDWKAVQDAVRNKDGQWQRIAERKPELDRNAEIKIRVDKEGLRAYLDYQPPLGGKFLQVEEIRARLAAEGIIFGIKTEQLKKVAGSRVKQSDILIAEGIPPEHGRDSSVEYHFETEGVKKIGTKREDGSIDFFNLNLVQNVTKGEKLATCIPPTKGRPGKDVYGSDIPARDGMEKEPPAGNGTEVRDNVIYAQIDGQPRLEKGRVIVDPVYVVYGDVDLSIGNIDFNGSVVIKGSIQEGFIVKAKGDIEVGRNISGAMVEAGGNVVVKNGIIGQNKSLVRAGGDIGSKFVENATLEAGGSILVDRGIMHSRVTSDREIIVQGKGLIVGGHLEAASRIEANILGSSFATPTELIVGTSPEMRNRLQEYRERIKQTQGNLEKIVKTYRYLSRKFGQLKGKEKHLYFRCIKTKKLLEEQLQQLIVEKDKLEEKVEQSKSGCVVAREKIYPRVTVIIGNDSKTFRDTSGPAKLIKEEGEIRILSL